MNNDKIFYRRYKRVARLPLGVCLLLSVLGTSLVSAQTSTLSGNSPSAPAPAAGKTQQQLEEEIKQRVLPKFSIDPNTDTRTSGVRDAISKNEQLQEILRSSTSIGQAGQRIEEAVKEDPSLVYNDRFGATSDEIVETFKRDREVITSNFSQCQGSGQGHRLEQMMVEPIFVTSPCSMHVLAPLVESGRCVKLIPSFLCGVKIITAPLIDYNFPTAKIDVSEQPYQSMYLDESIVDVLEPLNSLMLGFGGAAVGARNVEIVRKAELDTMASLPDGRALAAPAGAATLVGRNMNDSMAPQARIPASMRSATPDSTRVYGRIIPEPLNFETAQMFWIPHVVMPSPMFGSDFPPYLTLTSRSLDITSMAALGSPRFLEKMRKFLLPGGMFNCIARNKMTGKTATDLLIPGVEAFDPALCIDNIGERFPLTDTRRSSITDRSWRGIAKDLDMYLTVYPESVRYTYEENKDTFLVLRNDKFRNESPGCRPLNQMTRRNIDYATANEKDIGSGGENTVEVFTRFKGCWGFKGKGTESGFWTYIFGGPTRLK